MRNFRYIPALTISLLSVIACNGDGEKAKLADKLCGELADETGLRETCVSMVLASDHSIESLECLISSEGAYEERCGLLIESLGEERFRQRRNHNNLTSAVLGYGTPEGLHDIRLVNEQDCPDQH